MPRKKPEDLQHANPEPVTQQHYTPEPVYDGGTTVEMGTNNQTRKVKLDLEVDTSVKDLGPNPFVKVIHLARAIDAWRIFPRIFISVYIYLLYAVVSWFMGLDNPTMEQSGLVSIIVGAGAAWFGLYVGSGGRKK